MKHIKYSKNAWKFPLSRSRVILQTSGTLGKGLSAQCMIFPVRQPLLRNEALLKRPASSEASENVESISLPSLYWNTMAHNKRVSSKLIVQHMVEASDVEHFQSHYSHFLSSLWNVFSTHWRIWLCLWPDKDKMSSITSNPSLRAKLLSDLCFYLVFIVICRQVIPVCYTFLSLPSMYSLCLCPL